MSRLTEQFYERVCKIILDSLLETLNKKNKLTQDQLNQEKGEFEREGLKVPKSDKGRGVDLPAAVVANKVSNTDVGSIDSPSRFGRLRQWARTMQSNQRGKDRRRRVFNQVTSNTDDPSIIRTGGRKGPTLVAGNTRATLRAALEKPIKATVFRARRRR